MASNAKCTKQILSIYSMMHEKMKETMQYPFSNDQLVKMLFAFKIFTHYSPLIVEILTTIIVLKYDLIQYKQQVLAQQVQISFHSIHKKNEEDIRSVCRGIQKLMQSLVITTAGGQEEEDIKIDLVHRSIVNKPANEVIQDGLVASQYHVFYRCLDWLALQFYQVAYAIGRKTPQPAMNEDLLVYIFQMIAGHSIECPSIREILHAVTSYYIAFTEVTARKIQNPKFFPMFRHYLCQSLWYYTNLHEYPEVERFVMQFVIPILQQEKEFVNENISSDPLALNETNIIPDKMKFHQMWLTLRISFANLSGTNKVVRKLLLTIAPCYIMIVPN